MVDPVDFRFPAGTRRQEVLELTSNSANLGIWSLYQEAALIKESNAVVSSGRGMSNQACKTLGSGAMVPFETILPACLV